MIVTLPLSTPPALSVRNGPRELVIQVRVGGSVIAGLKRIRCPRDARKERPGAWQCVLLGRFRCAGRPWRCIPNVTRGERHLKRSSAPAPPIGLGEFYPTAIDVRNADTDAPISAHTDKTLAARQRHERQRDLVAKACAAGDPAPAGGTLLATRSAHSATHGAQLAAPPASRANGYPLVCDRRAERLRPPQGEHAARPGARPHQELAPASDRDPRRRIARAMRQSRRQPAAARDAPTSPGAARDGLGLGRSHLGEAVA
jgi:hypothetical protein